MSFAIYGESDGYVHLVSADTQANAAQLFVDDILEVGVKLGNVYNIYAVENNREDKELEDFIEKMIEESKQSV